MKSRAQRFSAVPNVRALMAVLALAACAAVACKGHSDTASVTVSIDLQELESPAPPAPSASLGVNFGRSSNALSYADVASIRVNITDSTNNNPLYVNFDLTQSAGRWSGTFPFLPKNRSLTFTAHALDAAQAELFSGTTVQSLSNDNQNVSILLSPNDNGRTISLPRIKKILVPVQFTSGQGDNVSFFIEANTGEQLSWTLSAASGAGSFLPASGSITLTGIAGTFVSQYVPPQLSTGADITHTVTVTNETGHSVSTTFTTHVLPVGATQGVQDTRVNTLFSPVIDNLSARRILGTGNVIWTASVVDDGPQSGLTYHWSFAPNGTFTPAPAFSGDTNPSTLQNYTPSVEGQLLLSVSDAQGGTTTLHYPLAPNQFPDNPDSTTRFNAIRAGASHTCVLMNNGTVRCWGRNNFGQLGYGNTFNIGDDEPPYTAGDVPIAGEAIKLATGADHSCVLLNTGFVRCWGRNDFGQLGYNTTENVGDGEAISSFGYVNLGGSAVQLAAGQSHTCALLSTGKVRCWGLNNHGQLGYGHSNNIGDDEAPFTAGNVNVGGTVTDIVAGGDHSCALLDTGKVRCWGRNDFGQLGYGHTHDIGLAEAPATAGDVDLGGNALQLSAGAFHTCALLDSGNIRCWGHNASGQLGYGNTADIGDDELPSIAGDINVGGQVRQVAAGRDHTCALLSTGPVKCWGFNGYGQLGYGNTTPLTAPPGAWVDLNGATANQITAGGDHTCALLGTGKALCWGLNTFGQLGYGHANDIGDDELPSTAGDIQVYPPNYCTTDAECTPGNYCSGNACIPRPPPPSLTSISPAQAKAGMTVTLTGTQFISGAAGKVGSTPCSSATFTSSTTLTCTIPALTDGTYAVTVTNPDGQSSTLASALVYDSTPPTGGGTLNDGTFSSSLTSSPPLTWTAFSDAGSGIDHYEYAVGTTAGGLQTKGWTSFTPGTGPGTTITGLTLTPGTTYYPSIRVFDRVGNFATLTGNGWVVDTAGPSAPTGLNDGTVTNVPTTAPTATWTASADAGSGVAYYELAIGTSAGGTDILPWTNIGKVTSSTRTGLTLAPGTTYYTSVRAYDALGNVGAAATGDGWTYTLSGPTTLVFLPMDNLGTGSGDNASADFVNLATAGASFHPVLAPAISTVSPRFGSGSGCFKNGHLETTNSPANVIGNSDFTIELWVKYTGSLDGAFSTVLSGNGWDISLGNTNYNNNADFSYGNQSARWWGGAIGWGVLPTGVWSHLSISRSGTNLYTHLNGVLKQTATIPANARLEANATTSILSVGSFSPAYIDDLLITVGGVRHTTANFSPVQVGPTPYIYLPMDGPGNGEPPSPDFRNTVPGGVTLTPTGTPAISSSSTGCGGCGDFTSGTLATSVATGNAIGTRDFTIEFWVNPSVLGGGGSPVISAGTSTSTYWDISLGNTYYNNTANFAYYTTENSGYRHWGGDIGWGVLPLNAWTHLSLTRLGTTLITHKNGVLVETLTIPATDRMEGPNGSSAITIGSHPCFMDDVMITLGTARHTTANFPVARVPNFPRLVVKEPYVFLPFDGTNGSTVFPNLAATGVAFTAVSSPTVTTATSRYGGASGNFQAGSLTTAATAANVIGTRDFTIELWVNFSARGGGGTPVVSGNGWDISLGNDFYNNGADFSYGNQGARWWGGIVGWGVLPFNTWTHLAVSRSQDRLYTHKNGVLVSTVSIPSTANMEAGALTSALAIGQSASYIDDVMITIGSAKYTTADFGTPPQLTKPFMYLPMDGANLSTSFPNYGAGPVVSNVSSPSITTTTAVHGGASANLTAGSLATANAYRLGTQDFTIEFWVKPTSLGIFGTPVLWAGNGSSTYWDISLGNSNYNNSANFAYYATENGGYRHWGGDIGWGNLVMNTWVHLSLSRSGTRLYTHKNGVLVSTVTIAATDAMEGPNTTSVFTIGGSSCYVDDLMITIGKARHTTANFTVYP